MKIPAMVFCMATLLAAGVGAQTQRAGRPNIIYIMTDDHAAHAIGAYGSRVNKTPHLDRLAREGALLTSVFATNSICTPSRAAILTGQYSHINGVTMFNRFDSSRMTVARLLQQERLLFSGDHIMQGSTVVISPPPRRPRPWPPESCDRPL